MENIIYSKNGFEIENLNPEIAKIYPKLKDLPFTGFDSNRLILDFGKKEKGDLATCSLRFRGNLEIKKTGASCGCTVPHMEKDGDDTIVTVIFDPHRITRGVSKAVYIYTKQGDMTINLIINKN